MFLHKVRSEGLAHLSYVVGDGGHAAVIDPRRDCDSYVEIAEREGCHITHIFETHRNEDYVVGSTALAVRTGADIYHGAQLDFEYGNAVSDGDTFELGDMLLKVLHTPGHTMESISLALSDTGFGERAVGVFTGDVLFVGDVGRTDFFPERAEEVAAMLYDSIHEKLLPLGDGVILYPAHGSGSVCGDAMASREFSTLGHERECNPRLQLDRVEFVDFKVAEHHYQPPYFRKMEEFNLEGAPVLDNLPAAKPLPADEFAAVVEDGAMVLDLRSPEANGGARLPGSLTIAMNMVASFAGWFLPYDRPVALVADDPEDAPVAVRNLHRLGYDDIAGYLQDGLHGWEITGRKFERIPQVTAQDLDRRIREGKELTLLDVRKKSEFENGHLEGAVHIYVGELLDRIEEVPGERPVVTFCGSGRRAIIGASVLRRAGIEEVENCLGSMQACEALGCSTATG
ncbi:MAG: MBL fold metallo-hydrolase [Candidatus Brocadiia bacterium]